jgi:hypothetical protein
MSVLKIIVRVLLVMPVSTSPSIVLAQVHAQASSSHSTVTDWLQAIGSILAITAGFAVAAWQFERQNSAEKEKEAAVVRAANTLAWEALSTVGERFENALTSERPKKRRQLQGHRTTEMVLALREFNSTRLPGELLSDLIRLRSYVHAINERITEVYASEEPDTGDGRRHKLRRRGWLVGSGRVWTDAVDLIDSFQSKSKVYGAVPRKVYEGERLAEYIAEIKRRDRLSRHSSEST